VIVTNTNDNGPGSLRQALADAQNGDIIEFNLGPNAESIMLTSGELLSTEHNDQWSRSNLSALSHHSASIKQAVARNIEHMWTLYHLYYPKTQRVLRPYT
jgi:hypothetical protein